MYNCHAQPTQMSQSIQWVALTKNHHTEINTEINDPCAIQKKHQRLNDPAVHKATEWRRNVSNPEAMRKKHWDQRQDKLCYLQIMLCVILKHENKADNRQKLETF